MSQEFRDQYDPARARARLMRDVDRVKQLSGEKGGRVISFAWTSPALLAGKKTVTRRAWKPSYARLFRRGDRIQAFDRSPRNGGKKIAVLELTADPYLEPTSKMTLESYQREGLTWLHAQGFDVPDDLRFNAWRDLDEEVWVIEFELLEVC